MFDHATTGWEGPKPARPGEHLGFKSRISGSRLTGLGFVLQTGLKFAALGF